MEGSSGLWSCDRLSWLGNRVSAAGVLYLIQCWSGGKVGGYLLHLQENVDTCPLPQLLKGSFCLTSEADSCVWLCSSELRRVVLFKNQYELWRESSLLVAQCKDFIVSYSKEGNHRRQFQEIFQEFFFWGNTLHLTIGADEKKMHTLDILKINGEKGNVKNLMRNVNSLWKIVF